MDIWNTRSQSNIWLQNELFEESKKLYEGFDLLNKCITSLDGIGTKEGDNQIRRLLMIGAITLAKSCHFLLGCYSLSLDGLSQESGALLRPLLETYELMIYLHLDPLRVEEVINDKLPKAGAIAKEINGKLHGLRQYLNEHASHFMFKYDSVRHLVDFSEGVIIKPIPKHDLSVFTKNLDTINVIQTLLLVEASNWMEYDSENTADDILEIRDFCESSDIVFNR